MAGNPTRPKATAGGLTPAQERAVELLAAGQTVGDVAAAVGVHRVTLWEWAKLPAFRQAQDQLRREAWRAAEDRMRRNVTRAAEVIGEVLDDAQADPRDRLMAAKLVLDRAGALIEAPAAESEASTWEAVVHRTAERAAGMLGGHVSAYTRGTAGQLWAAAGLTRGSFAEVERLRQDPAKAEDYCKALLEELRQDVDREAFEDEDQDGEGGQDAQTG